MEQLPFMYASCLFCNGRLGTNAELETFPVGRRLAYDPSKGRLWVVCPKCTRWNLTPLESRWEAIEEAERAYRSALIRRSTENIGLAQLRGRLELVRIGRPPRLELAAWRYGGHLRLRRAKYYTMFGAGAIASALPVIGALGVGVGVSLMGTGAAVAYTGYDIWRWRRDRNVATVFIKDHHGKVIALSKWNTWAATITAVPNEEWYLTLPYPIRDLATHRLINREKGQPRLEEIATLSGDVAKNALGKLVPHANLGGGSALAIREALDVIEAASTLDRLMGNAAKIATPVTRMAGPYRLALEMVLHEEDESRAMAGELASLQQRWREAEEIAAIADTLL